MRSRLLPLATMVVGVMWMQILSGTQLALRCVSGGEHLPKPIVPC